MRFALPFWNHLQNITTTWFSGRRPIGSRPGSPATTQRLLRWRLRRRAGRL